MMGTKRELRPFCCNFRPCLFKSEVFFLAAARIARRRLRRAEAAAAVVREAALAEIRVAKELSAADQAANNKHGGVTERLLRGLEMETKREKASSDEKREDEESNRNKVCAHPAA